MQFLRRELDCQLPIEVGYIDDGNISSAFEKELRALTRMEGKAFMADLLSVALGQASNLVGSLPYLECKPVSQHSYPTSAIVSTSDEVYSPSIGA